MRLICDSVAFSREARVFFLGISTRARIVLAYIINKHIHNLVMMTSSSSQRHYIIPSVPSGVVRVGAAAELPVYAKWTVQSSRVVKYAQIHTQFCLYIQRKKKVIRNFAQTYEFMVIYGGLWVLYFLENWCPLVGHSVCCRLSPTTHGLISSYDEYYNELITFQRNLNLFISIQVCQSDTFNSRHFSNTFNAILMTT